jgi:poly(ribitol-phosphate) beta-N-acetylglucosaminyltransferase
MGYSMLSPKIYSKQAKQTRTKEKSLSCPSLHHEIYLGPDEIRTCCKRFFVQGEKRGDVVLKKVQPNEIITSDIILEEKRKLFNKINSGEENDCEGCPFLENKEWGELEELSIQHISFEYHSVCNMKCVYCSETFHGGLKSQYDVQKLFSDLLREGVLSNCNSVVWGGGESSIGQNFEELITEVSTSLDLSSHRVLTNALEFNEEIKRLLDVGSLNITTSIDAGCEETFASVRGFKGGSGLEKVLCNLARYAEGNPENVIIKYIFTKGNTSSDELIGFCNNIKKHELFNCSFQLSYDFENENVSAEDLISLIFLRHRLVAGGAKNVFFDDLLWMRIGNVYEQQRKEIDERLSELKIKDGLANPAIYSKVVVWGAGQLAVDLVAKAYFFKSVEIECFVDSDSSKWGSQLLGKEVLSPETLLNNNYTVVIAAAQYFSDIIESLELLQIERSRLVRGLVL